MKVISSIFNQNMISCFNIFKTHFEKIYSAKLNYVKMKFIQDVYDNIYFIGISEHILYTPIQMRKIRLKKVIRLKSKKVSSLVIGSRIKSPNAQANFENTHGMSCFLTLELQMKNSKTLVLLRYINKVEYDKIEAGVHHNQQFQVYGTIIKKAAQHPRLVLSILNKHGFKVIGDSNKSVSINESDDKIVDFNDNLISIQNTSQRSLAEQVPPPDLDPKFNLSNFQRVYKIYKVCQNCYQVYAMLTEYFNELE